MRSILIIGLLMTLWASANAATLHHHRTRHHVVIPPGVASSFAAVPDGARIYRDDSVPGGLRTDHDDPPSYNDPSKSGSENGIANSKLSACHSYLAEAKPPPAGGVRAGMPVLKASSPDCAS